MKKHSQWDQKNPAPHTEEEDHALGWQEWKAHNISTPLSRNVDVPAPLDYSTESRNRSEGNQRNCDHGHDIVSGEEGIDLSKPPPMLPPTWPVYSNFPSFPGSSRSSSMTYPHYSSMQHPAQYYNDNPYHMKWWPHQRPPSNQYTHGNHFSKKDKKGYVPYNMNTRPHKEHPPYYSDFSKRYPNNKNHFDKLHSKENQLQPASYHCQKNKYKLDDLKYPHNGGINSFNSKYHTSSSSLSNDKYFNNRHGRSKDDSSVKLKRSERYPIMFKQNFPPAVKGKNMQNNKSTAEEASSKAFHIAANKLRQAFLATKTGKRTDYLKLIKRKGKSSKVQSMPSNNEDYIPIQRDVLYEDECNVPLFSDGASTSEMTEGSVLTVSKNSSNERHLYNIADSDSDESNTSINDLYESKQHLIKHKRKRHCSDSSVCQRKKPVSFEGRSRRYSTSNLEVSSSMPDVGKDLRSTNLGRVKGLVAEHLLKLDKGQIQELINETPGSRKLKLLMDRLNSASGSHFAEKLLNKRMMLQSSLTDERDELEMAAQMDILTDDVFQQVKEILDMEATGKGNSCWDEISLSIADLISGSIIKSQRNLSYESNHSEYLESEIEILTPPPKTPATMITLADSDTDLHPTVSSNESSLAKGVLSTSSISPEMSHMYLSPPRKHDLQTTPLFSHRFRCLVQSPKIKRSLSNAACLLPIPSLPDNADRDTSNTQLEETTIDANSLEETRKAETPVLQEDDLCDINIPSSLVKVKEERPSPISECSLCMHSARSPHTPQCGFAYGIANSPVPLITEPLRPLASSAQRPVPRMPTDLSHIFKHEKPEGTTYVSLENIDRPSSEERPKNPAPPDNASTEPPSPLPIPSPQSSLHPPPTRQLLFSDNNVTVPPRPQPPPPLEHSPRIKFERQTPNSSFACYCLRSECDHNDHSGFHRSEHQRVSHNQICEPRGSHLYKMEAPYMPNTRARTPQNMLNLFAIPAAPTRCIIPNNTPTATNIRVPSHQVSAMVTVAVQTEPLNSPSLVDKSTNIDLSLCPSNESNLIANCEPYSDSRIMFSDFDSLIAEVKSLKNIEDKTRISFQENLVHREDQVFCFLSQLEKQEKELNYQKNNLIQTLRDLSKLRRSGTVSDNNSATESVGMDVISVNNDIPILSPIDDMQSKLLKMESCENMSVVSSSQEVESTVDRPLSPYAHHTEEMENERCTSTSGLGMPIINESEDSIEFDSFVKEEHTTQEFESTTICNAPQESVLSLKQTSEEFETLPLPIVNNKQPDDLHIIENDADNKFISTVHDSGEDVIIMGDMSQRKMVLFSPLSPKTRNSSGSEHGYSLRSRGPPSDSYDYNSDNSLLLKESTENGNFIGIVCSTPKKISQDNCINDNKPEIVLDIESSDIIVDSIFKKRKKRKAKKQRGKWKKKRKKHFDFENLTNLAHNSHSFGNPSINLPQQNSTLVMPEQTKSSILTIKIAGNFIFTGCGDSFVRVYDILTGKLCNQYSGHKGAVNSLIILGNPEYTSDLSHFRIVTGSEDRYIRIFEAETAQISLRLNATEPITCLEHCWKYIFIGTRGGYGIKWNLKDKKLGDKIQFCPEVITCMVPHTEGGRKVLLIAAKSCNLMIRDAMSGLFLRSLEYAPLTVYTAIFDGNILYAGGSDNIIYVYDFCSGAVKEQINVYSSMSSLLLRAGNIIATCYDGFVRIINLTKKELIHTLPVESSHKMFTSSFLYENQVILGNKYGEVVMCNLPHE